MFFLLPIEEINASVRQLLLDEGLLTENFVNMPFEWPLPDAKLNHYVSRFTYKNGSVYIVVDILTAIYAALQERLESLLSTVEEELSVNSLEINGNFIRVKVGKDGTNIHT